MDDRNAPEPRPPTPWANSRVEIWRSWEKYMLASFRWMKSVKICFSDNSVIVALMARADAQIAIAESAPCVTISLVSPCCFSAFGLSKCGFKRLRAASKTRNCRYSYFLTSSGSFKTIGTSCAWMISPNGQRSARTVSDCRPVLLPFLCLSGLFALGQPELVGLCRESKTISQRPLLTSTLLTMPADESSRQRPATTLSVPFATTW
mmetsp:Transcript_5458/g.16093  ORF Transcript_5458/g.16093 Transcript_5458/m.16093 type:complete len:206 (-) Transcript_5458:74-691(-)